MLTPDKRDQTLQIDLRWNLAAMLGATVQTKRSPESDDLSLQVSLVAEASNQRYLQLSRRPREMGAAIELVTLPLESSRRRSSR